jgi:hypothetical protein
MDKSFLVLFFKKEQTSFLNLPQKFFSIDLSRSRTSLAP